MKQRSMVRFAGVALVALALVAAACGKSNNGAASGGSTTAGGGTTSAGGTTSGGSASGGGSGKAIVDTSKVGSLGTVLVDANGMTLYHLTGETTSKFVCTGGCTTEWPPLQATAGTPTGGSGATGTLDTAMRPDGGQQVTYDGMPLYTFSGDTKPGQANGQGFEGKWFALTAAGKNAGGGASGGGTTGTSGSSSGGGRYGGY